MSHKGRATPRDKVDLHIISAFFCTFYVGEIGALPRRFWLSEAEGEVTMREEQRQYARRKLDKEMRYYRIAAREEHPTQELLRTVRRVLGVPVEEISRELKVSKSVVFRLEASERRGVITFKSMTRVANAMGCQMVYALIPRDGGTLEEMAERRKWSRLLEEERE